MKKVKIILGLLAFVSLQGCSDFLSETPDNRTELNSPEKISELLVNAYPQTNYMYFTEMMTDNVGDSKRTDHTELDNTNYFKFVDHELSDYDSPAWYWTSAYEAIAHANQALDAIEKMGNPANLAPLRGEALLARAYAHFMLISIFSEAYDPATADSKLGVPYMKDVEVNLLVNYKRNTLAEVISLIEEDILEGLPIVGNKYKQPKFHFTPNAGKAFAAKFYTYIGNWDKVLEYSESLGDAPAKKLRDLNDYSELSFPAQEIKYPSKEESTNLLIGTGPSIHGRNVGRKRFGMTNATTSVFRGSNPFSKEWAYTFVGYNGFGISFPTKFNEYFKYSNASAGIGQPFHAFVLLSNDDLYLNRIEAVVMKGDFDRAARMLAFFAKHKTKEATDADLPKLTVAKIMSTYPNGSEYQPYYTLTSQQQSFVKAVAEYRRREFASEGARFFDIKRFNLEVTHKTLVENETFILEKHDLRKAIQLPKAVFQYGVEPNPRN